MLAILFLLRREEPARGIAQAAGVGLVLVVFAGVVSTTDAVAKPAFLSWQSWDPYDRPTGCPFHPRCAQFMAGRCDRQAPALSRLTAGHAVSCFLYE